MAKIYKSVENITHDQDTRTNIPTKEYENLLHDEAKKPIELKYPRNPDLDPQLTWSGKDNQDWSDLVVTAPPIYIQEKINPKHIIDDLIRQSKKRDDAVTQEEVPDFFANMFDGDLSPEAKTEFYAHDQNWTNRMILGDSLQVMASLAGREGLCGKIQCIYFDPPYGIKFSSNWQVSTRSTDVGEGVNQITREPEMVKAFRDTWSNGIHSYLTYLRDRLTVARDLLHESGSIFLQIGDDNVHRVRSLMDEVFGCDNSFSMICFKKKNFAPIGSSTNDYILWYGKSKKHTKINELYLRNTNTQDKPDDPMFKLLRDKTGRTFTADKKISQSEVISKGLVWAQTLDRVISQHRSDTRSGKFEFQGNALSPGENNQWTFDPDIGLTRLAKASRLSVSGKAMRLRGIVLWNDVLRKKITNFWDDTGGAANPIYVVQTGEKIVQRCLNLTTDPGDLVLDPTCGSGTTAATSEKWGRRWITIDTSRVALALARSRIIGSKYPYYLLADSEEGVKKEQQISGRIRCETTLRKNIRAGFVCQRAAIISLKNITENQEIDQIWDNYQESLEPLRIQLNATLKQSWEEWEIPYESDAGWPDVAQITHAKWWNARIARQKEIDDSIVSNAETQYLYDSPYIDTSKVRVAGPFTVESLSPHKAIAIGANGEWLDNVEVDGIPNRSDDEIDFGNVIFEHLRTAGVQQAHKEERIKFTSIDRFPGTFISGVGRYLESDSEIEPQKRAGIFIGPEYGTLGRADIVVAAREARELQFDILVTCAFNYDAHSSEIERLADLPILKARINPDLHMADELKNTGSGNLFVVFGEPDINIIETGDGRIQIKINGVDVFHPSKGEVVSGGPESIAAWFIDTDYNEESFFVRHVYFLGENDPYKQLKKSLKAEIDKEAWESLNRDTSRPFPKPETGRIAIKVINHLGDEVMKVFNVD